MTIKGKIKPLGNNVMIEVEKQEETKGGLILPDAKNYIMEKAKVIAIGDLVTSVKVGDVVYFKSWGLDTVDFGDEKISFIKEDLILGHD